jgi:flagellar motor switch protein FliN/FliY
MEGLLEQASQALASVDQPPAPLPPGMKPFEFRSLASSPASTQAASLELLRDVQLDLKIELGRTHMQLEEVLQLKKGAVVTLDKLAGDPVDIFVNGRLIARGEVLVLNDSFCVRVAELIAGENAIA